VPSARLPFEDPKVVGAGIASTVAGNLIRGKGRATPLREGLAAAIGFVPALVSLTGSDLAAYHAAEHKSIGGYEQDRDPAEVPKEHERCGSNLILPLLGLSVAGQLLVERLVRNPRPIARGLAGLASVSAAVEVFAYAERAPDSPLGRGIHAAGHEIQRVLSTAEPSDDQLEVGSAALQEILRAETGETSLSSAA